jgi:hypothetical protein
VSLESWRAISPSWRLCDPLTVRDAAALIAGVEPDTVYFRDNYPEWFEKDGWTDTDGIEKVKAAYKALINAVTSGKLKAGIHTKNDAKTLDAEKTRVAVSDLRAWLEHSNYLAPFFFPEKMGADRQEDHSDLLAELEEAQARITSLEKELEKERQANKKREASRQKIPIPRDQKLLETIAALMAAWPGSAIPSGKELEKAAQSVGLKISDDTIRKVMESAREIAPSLPVPK